MKAFPLDIPSASRRLASPTEKSWLWIAVTAAVVLLMSLPDTLFGVELGDTGFYMTFYENFFSAPESVEYNYMYWLSGFVGRCWLGLWPDGGLIWMRLGGACCLVGIALAIRFCCVSLLGGRHSESVSLGVVVLVSGTYFRGVHILGYDLVTCLIGSWGLVLTASALMRGKSLIPGALLLGINAFTRLTNICEIVVIILVPLSYRFMTGGRYPGRLVLRRSLEWLGGWIAGVAAVALLIVAFGQGSIMASNIHDLVGIASGSTGQTTHNLEYLQLKSMKMWGSIFKRTLILGGFLLPAIIVDYRRKKTDGNGEASAKRSLLLPILYSGGVACWLALSLLRQDGNTLFATASLLLAGSTCALLQTRFRRASALAWGGILMMRLLPMGCDGILLGVGSTALAVAAAVAGWWVSAAFRRGRFMLWGIAILFSVVCGVRMYRGGAYMDDGPLGMKTAGTEIPQLRGALTTPQRAAALEEIVGELNESVSPRERIILYGGAPGLYWLSGTLPAFGNSWPEQLSPSQLEAKLNELSMNGDFPAVVIHEFDAQTYGDFVPDPTYGEGGGEETPYHLAEKNRRLHAWLRESGYRLERGGKWFSIYRKID